MAALDYFISYTSADKAWAEWIGWVLEAGGASVRLQAWDFAPGSNFVLEMQKAAAAARRTIAVLSPDYVKSQFAAPEWAAAFADDPEGLTRKLVPVRVRDCELKGMLKTVVHIDLVGLDQESVQKKLRDGLGAKRGKPDKAPPFPGFAPAAGNSKPFPAVAPASTSPSSARLTPFIPKIRGAISDLDRSRFIKHAFETVRQYFESGLHALASSEPAVDTELTRRGDTDFVAEIFVSGTRQARCRIWLGGMMGGGNQISYYEGNQDMGNAVNESLTIAHEQQDGLALNAMMNMGIGMNRLPSEIDPSRMSPEHAAEYLWHRFLWRLHS
jgi:hypothetical protein